MAQLALGLLVVGCGRFDGVFLAPIVLALELFDSTSRVDKLLLAREERVRGRTDIDCDQRHRLTFIFARLLRFDGRAD